MTLELVENVILQTLQRNCSSNDLSSPLGSSVQVVKLFFFVTDAADEQTFAQSKSFYFLLSSV
jgi:hypothetical protein